MYKSNLKLSERHCEYSPQTLQNQRSPGSTTKLFNNNKTPPMCRETSYLQTVKRQSIKKKAPTKQVAQKFHTNNFCSPSSRFDEQPKPAEEDISINMTIQPCA